MLAMVLPFCCGFVVIVVHWLIVMLLSFCCHAGASWHVVMLLSFWCIGCLPCCCHVGFILVHVGHQCCHFVVIVLSFWSIGGLPCCCHVVVMLVHVGHCVVMCCHVVVMLVHWMIVMLLALC